MSEQVWEIINPSDRYTIAGARAVVGVAVLLLTNGQTPVVNVEDRADEALPFIWTEEALTAWCAANLGGQPPKVYLDEHREEIAAALDSVIVGNRQQYELALEAESPENVGAFRLRWDDEHRTSLRQLGVAAWTIAKRLRAREVPNAE